MVLRIKNLGRIGRKTLSLFMEFLGDHLENIRQRCQCFLASWHKRVARADGRNLCNPRAVVLAVKDGL